MYFPGADAARQTMPEVREEYPVATRTWPTDPSFQNFTVECWAKPEDLARDQTVVERAIWTDPSNPGDQEYLRRNFQIALRGGKWMAKYDSGTLTNDEVKAFSASPAAAKWTHLAATFDGSEFRFYVDGVCQNGDSCGVKTLPENGVSAYAFVKGTGAYAWDIKYECKAILVGASFKGYAEGGKPEVLDVTSAMGWSYYKDFFKGYVDEIRIWDGARTVDEIRADLGKRYTAADALENRTAFYKQWANGADRYALATTVRVVPELRYHFHFDSVPGAADVDSVMKAPTGFHTAGGKPVLSRPVGYAIDWFAAVAGGYGTVYGPDCDWIQWIPNTVAHLPRYDGTTLDSFFWSEDYTGKSADVNRFARTAEPVSRWTQMAYNGVERPSRYKAAPMRHHLVYEIQNGSSNVTSAVKLYQFAGRHLNQMGDDLLPLGGAFVKYAPDLWDGQGPSAQWEHTGDDTKANMLPDWYEEYVRRTYGLEGGVEPDTDVFVPEYGRSMKVRELYLRNLARGIVLTSDGKSGEFDPARVQVSSEDGLIPDWWKSLYKIDGEDPLADGDNDGLNNYFEYVASELLPFSLFLNPLMACSDTKTLDYFRKVGRLYVGEMLTDHDQMEDHWERSLGDAAIADATVWDALKDADGDGWTNFDENRYNGYKMSTLAQLASHAVGDDEVLDAPIPSVTIMVRYNGSNLGKPKDGDSGKSGENEDNKEASTLPNLIVRTSTKTGGKPDAEYVLAPGQVVNREVYIGGWEDRVVRGTMSPGNIDIGSVNIKFAQIPQSDTYSWTDESGTHLARPYSEFKEAFDKNPDIIQNIQDFTWLELVAPVNQYTSSDRAVTVSREKLTQTGYIAVYGERVGTVDLTTGEFEFDLAAMNNLRVNYTYDGSKGSEAAWSYKEAIFKITYTAKVPAAQADRFQVTLAKADSGFMKSGKNSFEAFFDNDGNGEYTPGEPFGVLNDVEIGWSGRTLELELTDMSAITPRVDLWADASDRVARWGDLGIESNRVVTTVPQADLAHVRVVRYQIDDTEISRIGVESRVLLDRTFDRTADTLLHEGNFLKDDEFDIDWSYLVSDISHLDLQSHMVTNVSYLVVIGDGASGYEYRGGDAEDTNTVITALSTVINRRFETTRTKPVPHLERCVFTKARPTFAWTLQNEDAWASAFGTTYTAFKIVVKSGSTKVYESPVTRMPAKDSDGVYTWTPPLYVDAPSPSNPSAVFENLSAYTWQVYVYNAKFRRDGDPSDAQTFRMNVTHQDLSSCSIAVAVSYAGPAAQLANRIRVQAFESPDFTGDPVAEKTVGSADATVVLDGLAEGDYFIRAYIDTNRNGVHDEWESWGYLNERDLASKADIFNPVIARARFNADARNVRTVHIEDCDTDGDWFPDVWEAEQNGGAFVPFKSGKGQGSVTGNAELIGVNTNLDANLTKAVKGLKAMRTALNSANGVSLMTGIDPANVEMTAGGLEVKSEIDPETLTIVGFSVDAAQNRVLLKVGAETTANVDQTVANFLNITVRKGAEVTVRVERAESPNGPWTDVPGVGGTVTVDRAGADIEVKLNGELPAQGYFRAKVREN
ncbi:MAG: LamG domain-containing protein [bacterium]|nr:LamG domain-containing protein [Candidatus Colisoma equi]